MNKTVAVACKRKPPMFAYVSYEESGRWRAVTLDLPEFKNETQEWVMTMLSERCWVKKVRFKDLKSHTSSNGDNHQIKGLTHA